MSVVSRTISSLPIAIERYVIEFSRLRKRLIFLRGLGWAMVFSLAWMLCCCLADRLLDLNMASRLAWLISNCAGVIWLMWRPVHEVFRKIDLSGEAARIERRTGRFGEKLQTVVSQLADSEHAGSAGLLEVICREVDEELPRVPVRSLVSVKPGVIAWVAAAGIVVLATGLCFWPALNLPGLMLRATVPWIFSLG